MMPRLTDQEKQEVIRFLEADKPLPEKYRFLLFDDRGEVELVWNGKTGEVCNLVLPFQTIEQVDEPRAEKPDEKRGTDDRQGLLFSTDDRGRQLKGWTNKLIWGDNKLILSSLKNGPLREEIEAQGVDVAKELWRRNHPDRKNLPKNFEDSLSMKFYEVRPNCATIPLERVLTADDREQLWDDDELDDAVNLVAETIEAAGKDQPLPEQFPKHLLALFQDYGKTLREGEWIEQRPAKRASCVRYDSAVRERLTRWISVLPREPASNRREIRPASNIADTPQRTDRRIGGDHETGQARRSFSFRCRRSSGLRPVQEHQWLLAVKPDLRLQPQRTASAKAPEPWRTTATIRSRSTPMSY